MVAGVRDISILSELCVSSNKISLLLFYPKYLTLSKKKNILGEKKWLPFFYTNIQSIKLVDGLGTRSERPVFAQSTKALTNLSHFMSMSDPAS